MKKLILTILGVGIAMGAASVSNLEIASAAAEVRIKDYKETMPGVLYRGGSIGMRPLSEAQLQRLCQDGVGHAIYTYDTGFQQKPARTCTMRNGQPGKIEYSYFHLQTHKAKSMEAIYNSIVNPAGGSVFVHCWNGWHASGEIAAMALKQFCDFTDDQAIEYWKANIGDKGKLPKYGRVLTRIRNFNPDPRLKLNLMQQRNVCPRQ